MRRLWSVLVLISLLLGFAYANPKYVKVKRVPSVKGVVKKVNPSANTIEITLLNTDKTKILKITPTTKLYKKTKAGQLKPYELKAKISDFKKGDKIIATVESTQGRLLKAKKVWDIRAFLVYTGQISTEADWAGVIKKIDKGRSIITIGVIGENRDANIQINKYSKVYVNDKKATIADFRVGTPIVAICRWPGYKEDMPKVVWGVEVKDAKTYVIHTFRDKFGPVVAKGTVVAVDMNKKIIKVGEPDGISKMVRFNRATRFIPGTSKIKKPSDFVGYSVYIFGKSSEEKIPLATQIINEEAISSLFEDILTSKGHVGGEITLLAMGELISLDSSRISVRVAGGKKVVCKIHPKTAFVYKGKQVSPSKISTGDWVMVKGVITPPNTPNIALVVVSFGRAGRKFRNMSK